MNWSSVFCVFGMALTRPSLTVQLASGVDVFFAHVCGQKADTSSNYCDNIQPYDNRRFSFCQIWHDFYIGFWKLPQIRTSNFRNILKYSGKHYIGFVGNLLLFLAVIEFWKSVKNWQSYHDEFGCYLLEHSVVYHYLWKNRCLHNNHHSRISVCTTFNGSNKYNYLR